MHRLSLLLWFLFIPAQGLTQEYPPYEKWNKCAHEANQDKWGVRKPTEEEKFEHGSHVLVFEYWNSIHQCSENHELIGVWVDDQRIALMSVEVLGEKQGSMERITLIDIPESGYTSFGAEPILLQDGDTPGIFILHPSLF